MIWALLIVGVFVVGVIGAATSNRPHIVSPADPDSPEELLRRDPAQALARYGTPADAERLIAEGRGDELRGLGWEGTSE